MLRNKSANGNIQQQNLSQTGKYAKDSDTVLIA
jgi:hypothetical protein